VRRIVGLTLSFLFLSAAVASQAVAVPDPYEINVILSLTGGAAFLGKQEQQSLQILSGVVNKQGGIGGRPVKFAIADDQSTPQVAVQLMQGIVAKKAPVVIGASLLGPCAAMNPLSEQAGPVIYCLSPGIEPKPNGYLFSASAAAIDDMMTIARFLRSKGWTRVALIVPTDATGQVFDDAFARALALPQNKSIVVVDHQHFAPTDLSIASQAEHAKASNPQAIIGWGTGAPFGTVIRAINDVGWDGPVIGGVGNMIYAQLAQYASFMPKEMYFSGRRAVTESARPGPVLDRQRSYFGAFAESGNRPDFANSLPWDPALIVVDALRHLGPNATAPQIRDYILGLHSWAGVNGIYDFRDGRQRGIGIDAVVIDRWDAKANRFTAASRPGGDLLR
jgi:branched-chain amino acid transport system substrate-binding protein